MAGCRPHSGQRAEPAGRRRSRYQAGITRLRALFPISLTDLNGMISLRSMRGTSQVYRRSITEAAASPRPSRRHQAPGHGLLPSATIFSAVLNAGTRLSFSDPSRGNYAVYLPFQRMTVAMFAPCLLGCHGTARQQPASHGTSSSWLPYKAARNGISRH
jgi:hypothetical protein